ncbi:unnamed protein product, partial [Didymodactylos carnosus]
MTDSFPEHLPRNPLEKSELLGISELVGASIDTRQNLRKQKLPQGYYFQLHNGQSSNNYDNPTTLPSVLILSTSAHLQNRLRQRVSHSLQAFSAKRLKSGRRRAKEHQHHIKVSFSEYNYLKSIRIRSQMAFFTNLKIVENLV